MKYIIIVNGKPESGKTTFEKECRRYLEDIDYANCWILSTIDPIKDIYRKLGWDGKKTNKARKDLSMLKQMWIDNCNGPIKYIIDKILRYSTDEDHVIFVDIREESEIRTLSEMLDVLQLLDIKCYKVIVYRPDNEGLEYGNKSDDMVGNDESLYNISIYNDGTLSDLHNLACKFIDDLFENKYDMEE